MHQVREFAAVAVIVAGSGILAVGLAGPASAVVLANQPIAVDHCQPNTSQDCPQAPEVHFTVPDGDAVTAFFTANPGHCSDINVRFGNDGNPAGGFQRVGPGQTVSAPISVGSGPHTVQVFAQGIAGGCNPGYLESWGGTVRVVSAPGQPLNPSQPAPPGQGGQAGPPVGMDGPPGVPPGDQHAIQAPFDPPGSDDLHVH